MKLFISYRRKSWAFTDRLVEQLRRRLDIIIFIDRQSIDETDFEQSILNHLRDSDAVLLIVSEYTFAPDRIFQDDDWVRREIREALALKKPIFMAFVDGLTPPADLPEDIMEIRHKQGINFYAEYFDAGVSNLIDFINRAIVAPRRRKQARINSSTQADVSLPTLTYHKHGSALLESIILPVLLLIASIIAFTQVRSSGEPFFVIGQAVFILLAGIAVVWIYIAYWIWRNETLRLSTQSLNVMRKRPLWLQDESVQMNLGAMERVFSVQNNLLDRLLVRGNLLVTLAGNERPHPIFTRIGNPQAAQNEILKRVTRLRDQVGDKY